MATKKTVETLRHDDATRRNIPTAEYQQIMNPSEQSPLRCAYTRRNRDQDPQLVWRGKDELDEANLVVHASPLYIQEKVHPKVLIDDLVRRSREKDPDAGYQPDLFADFNGLPYEEARTEFYQHEANWSNRMILGDSLQVMVSLAEREGLRGQVQCIYIDPPYGIKFNSNFQWSTASRNVSDTHVAHITREPEQAKAYRDTWNDGIHTYLSYLRDRFTIARELLSSSGSVFVQIGEENVHRVRAVMDEVFGDSNFVSLITCRTSSGTTRQNSIKSISDYIVWYCKNAQDIKFRRLLEAKDINTKTYNQLELHDGSRRPMTREERKNPSICPKNSRPYQKLPVHSMASGDHAPREFFKALWRIPPTSHWRYAPEGFERLVKASRIQPEQSVLRAVYYHDDYPAYEITNSWQDTGPETDKAYVVQTSPEAIKRCLLMTTDPGDLVLDPTCGAGTTAYVAEQWGRRWITIDTSRVALALARARIMGARYPYYLLADSREGQQKEADLTRKIRSEAPVGGNIQHGFVYKRVPHITLKDISHNTEIDIIWETFRKTMELLRNQLNDILGQSWEEWEIPRAAESGWSTRAQKLHSQWWAQHKRRQREIDASTRVRANHEYFYDRPYEDSRKVRVAGPFTVESNTPHRMLGVDENGDLLDERAQTPTEQDFAVMVLEHLRVSGVHQAHKEDRIVFTSLVPWPGDLICAEGCYSKGRGGGGR